MSLGPNDGANQLRVFVDADVLFAAVASPSLVASGSASKIVLSLAELTLIEAITSKQAVAECSRNLRAKLKSAEAAEQADDLLRRIIARSLRVAENSSAEIVRALEGQAHWKDLPLLAAALREECHVLTTFNVRDYQPGDPSIRIMRPGELVSEARGIFGLLG